VGGTSFATPLVTGAVVLLQQIYASRFGTLPSVDQVKSWLEQGSDPVYDSVTGITIGRLDVPKAAALIPQAPSSPSPPIATTQVTVTPTIAALPTTTVTVSPVSSTVPAVISGKQAVTKASVPSGRIDPLRLRALLRSMSVWAARRSGDWTQDGSQVQIWDA
jgi:type VI secretion system secreted protein VgrG